MKGMTVVAQADVNWDEEVRALFDKGRSLPSPWISSHSPPPLTANLLVCIEVYLESGKAKKRRCDNYYVGLVVERSDQDRSINIVLPKTTASYP